MKRKSRRASIPAAERCKTCDGMGHGIGGMWCVMCSGRGRAVKPTHGGKRKGAGAPVTTGMKATPPIHFRVSASQHAELTSAGNRRRPTLTASLEAKRRCFKEES